MTLTYRRVKGTQLTSAEADANVDHLLLSSNLTFTPSGTGLIRASSNTVSLALTDVQTYGEEKLMAKLRRAAQKAFLKNPIQLPEMKGFTAWVASTAYALADQRANGGKVYECTGAGTSASSGGPTGYGTGITDGTATWSYVEMQSGPVISVLTATPGGLTNSYVVVTHDAYIRYIGGNVFATTAGGAGNHYLFPAANETPAAGNCTGTLSNFGWAVEFQTDATKIDIQSDPHATVLWRVMVDGQYVTKTGQNLRASGGISHNVLDFTNTFGGARKERRITFECSQGQGFYGIAVAPTEKIWKPRDTDNGRLIVGGDSITCGDVGVTMCGKSFARVLGKLLGYTDVWSSGVGSTGYLATASGLRVKLRDRITDITNNNPDIIVLADGINDSSFSTGAITTEVTAVLNAIRAVPSLALIPIVVLGNFSGGTAGATAQGVETAIRAGVTAMNDTRILFVPTITPADGEIITGTGRVGATTNDGNADVYISTSPPHFGDAGAEYVAQRVAQAIREWIRLPY